MSATGSLHIMSILTQTNIPCSITKRKKQNPLPAGFFNAGNQTFVGELPEAHSTHPELPIDRMRPATNLTPAYHPAFKFRRLVRFIDPRFCCHLPHPDIQTN